MTQHSPVPSYYAASANPAPTRPVLQGACEADVCVVGAGYSGLSTALFLAEAGFRVVVLEAATVGWGASGRNGGQIVNSFSRDLDAIERQTTADHLTHLASMAFEGSQIIRQRVRDYGIQCDLKEGGIFAAPNARQLSHLEDQQALWRRFGYGNLELLDREGIRARVGTERYVGGAIDHTGGHIHPLNLALGEAAALESLGGVIHEHSAVTDIVHGQPATVKTDQGEVRAAFVVLAGNAYMGKLIPRLSTRVLPSASSVIATEPLSESLAQKLLPGDVAVCDPRTALDYFRLSADRRMLFGGLSNYTGMEPKNLVSVMRKKMRNVFPDLADIRVDYAWSGWIGIGINRMPQLGELAPNIRYIQAYSGHGVAPTHIMAKITAESIAGESDRFNVMAAIPHMPFPGGRVFGRPLLAAGGAYYKLMDLR